METDSENGEIAWLLHEIPPPQALVPGGRTAGAAGALASQFYLDGKAAGITAGSVTGNVLTLKLAAPSTAQHITCLDSKSWNPSHLLYGVNGIATLTFCAVPIDDAGFAK